MEQIKRNELKKISREFRSLASRVLNAHFREVNLRIKMMIDYVDATPLIKNYIDSVYVELNVEDALNDVKDSFGRRALSTGDTPEKEVNCVYQVLSYIAKHQEFPTSSLGAFYASSTKYQDGVDEFGARVVNSFVDEIDNFLMEVATDMGLDETKSFQVNVSGGSVQVNVANDQSQIYAEQANGSNADELNLLFQKLTESVEKAKLSPTLESVVSEQIGTLKQDADMPVKNKGRIQTALNTITGILKTVPTAVAALQAITELAKFLG